MLRGTYKKENKEKKEDEIIDKIIEKTEEPEKNIEEVLNYRNTDIIDDTIVKHEVKEWEALSESKKTKNKKGRI